MNSMQILRGWGLEVEVAVRLVNMRLTDSMDEVLDKMSLEELMEHVGRATNSQQEMYYI